jgi:hypothetical protein
MTSAEYHSSLGMALEEVPAEAAIIRIRKINEQLSIM